ncbi:MAG: arginine decarboxylase [Bacteroidetes bacterium]|nr:arginine decarboxylase [Bacteroidota bacterium]MDA1336322.1 arginine decarboxylase [Bacteroidota bacterium]
MKLQYFDLVDQTFDWPQPEFEIENNALLFHGIPMMELVERFGSPLRITYLPKIGENIRLAHGWFRGAMKKLNYPGAYHYCYVTKSSHFRHITEEVIKHGAHLETSSAFDLDIVKALHADGKLDYDARIICNGFKTDGYLSRIVELRKAGFHNLLPVIDNQDEFKRFSAQIDRPIEVGIRIATEEEPKFAFYTSRLGIGYQRIAGFYEQQLKTNPHMQLKMLHFFCNTGIRDTAYYWNELRKAMRVYTDLKKICPSLTALNIGGGLPTKNSLAFEYDYEYMIEAILEQIQIACNEEGVPPPDIYTEFGSFTVAEAGATIFKVIHQKRQNDREKWNLIDSSFMTTLPDSWAINKRFLMLPLNRWSDAYERVFLGGLTCDSDDYYNSEQHLNAIYLPQFKTDKPLYIGFFNTGAYQDNISGHGGVHHCLIPGLKHVLIDRDANDALHFEVFSDSQSPEEVLTLLGYKTDVDKNTAQTSPEQISKHAE